MRSHKWNNWQVRVGSYIYKSGLTRRIAMNVYDRLSGTVNGLIVEKVN